MLVGEASGEHEAREQLPFRPFAPAGSLLERIIRRMGLDRQMFSITNVCRCRPRNNWLEGNPNEYSALNHCRPNLDAAISARRPRVLVALGGTALRELTGLSGESLGISHLAGYVLPLTRWIPKKVPCSCIGFNGPEQNCFLCGGTGELDGQRKTAADVPVIGNFHPAFLRRGKASHQGVFARILQRAMNIAKGTDTNWLWNVDPKEPSTYASLYYQPRPSRSAADAYAQHVLANTNLVVSYDIETSESVSLDEDAREGFADTHVRLVQFFVEGLGAIALPWEPEFLPAIQAVLRSPNPKCGHNVWLFDNKVLKAASAREGIDVNPRGVIHDTLQMFHHWQPDLPAHLQFCAQFVQFPFPWKHLSGTDLPFYGCCDVDATLRLYTMLESTLRRDSIWGDDTRGYLGQVAAVRPILERMEDRGLPIDDAARLKLDAEFDLAQQELDTELQSKCPPEVCNVEPRRGPASNPSFGYIREPRDTTGLVQRDFTEVGLGGNGEPCSVTIRRWCRVLPFNPDSPKQLLAYMKAKKHPIPKGKEENEDGSQKDTTAKKELQRLAHKTGDTFYLKVIEYRELSKMRGTYINGFQPGPDGAVHTTFTFDTGTGQLTSRNPNIQNFPKHGRLAKAVRRMVAAGDGGIIVEADYKSYHVLTTGYCAEDPLWMRLARLDMHSFVAGMFLKCWGPEAVEKSDAELLEMFKWFKSDPERKRVRDKKAKPTDLGVGFGMGYRRLFQENLEYFEGEREAKEFHDMIRLTIGKKVFAWHDRIRKQAHEQQFLRSPFGHMRRFYEVFRWDSRKQDYAPGDQAEEAVAFLPANLAFGNIRETMKELARRGLDETFGLCNNVHDSCVFVFPAPRLDEFMEQVVPVLKAPSKVLIHPVLAPGGLSVDVEVAAGPNWSEMREVPVKVSESVAI
jgi:uracil-DNA glycosylase family 4